MFAEGGDLPDAFGAGGKGISGGTKVTIPGGGRKGGVVGKLGVGLVLG